MPKVCLPEVTDSVMFKLFRESPSDCRDEEDDVLLDDSDDGRAGFPVFPVSAFRRSFSAFNISISFYIQNKSTQKHIRLLFWKTSVGGYSGDSAPLTGFTGLPLSQQRKLF